MFVVCTTDWTRQSKYFYVVFAIFLLRYLIVAILIACNDDYLQFGHQLVVLPLQKDRLVQIGAQEAQFRF